MKTFSIGRKPTRKKASTPRTLSWLTTVVLHHTATRDDLTAEEMEQSMKNTWIKNRGNSHIPTHYIIDKRGAIVKSNPRTLNVWAVAKDKYNTYAQVTEANVKWIHIEMVWSFDKHAPTVAQYKALNQLLIWIDEKRETIWIDKPFVIKGHYDFASKWDPGPLFDWKEIKPLPKKKPRPIAEFNWKKRRVTQYTPCTEEGSPINDSESQGWSCNITASGLPLLNQYAWTMWACPMDFGIWKNWRKRRVLQIEWADWTRHDFECVDRWSLIEWQHIDLFVWLGDLGDSNYKSWTYANISWRRNVRKKR